MKKESSNKSPCLTEKQIGILAIRVLTCEERGWDEQAQEGLKNKIPEGLFVDKEDKQMKDHLMSCDSCREKLFDEVSYLRRYAEVLADAGSSDKIRDFLLKRLERTGKVKVLRLVFTDDSDGLEIAAAASTAEAVDTRRPLRFSNESGNLIMKEVIDETTGKSSFIVIGDNIYTNRSKIIINGNTYDLDKDGYLNITENIEIRGIQHIIVITDPLE